jgi:PIN domain nuclease of toxin-antitoxin system
MKLLADTQLLIWATLTPEHLPEIFMTEYEDTSNILLSSIVSLWEVAIKRGRNKPDFTIEPGPLRQSLFDAGFHELNIVSAHIFALSGLPHIHRDPFDRLLIAQAIAEQAVLFTADKTIAQYPGPIRFVG